MQIDTAVLFNIGSSTTRPGETPTQPALWKNREETTPGNTPQGSIDPVSVNKETLTITEQEAKIKDFTEQLLTPGADDQKLLLTCLWLVRLYSGNEDIYYQVQRNRRKTSDLAAVPIREAIGEILEDIEEGKKETAIISKCMYIIDKLANVPGYNVTNEYARAFQRRQEREDEAAGINPPYYIYRQAYELKRLMDGANIEKERLAKRIGKDKTEALEGIINDIIADMKI